ncbi:P-loop containing nucleoside triphosphate hydrolase [Glarea lozoyensis ATCC 20868]|uniref:GTP-binding protein 8 n=1 Tax=Glarea lozoyensis (strain ATCC 20868 / MF5171) TaxID=1116229 RepID=S3E6B9_GLAL2|nr:P-loop containing nucleoside triphosphate hydrolase [Glarea lozoyensis ATCC 20868]EPE33913.1 P-loop containing nucleoside triphosphate hydrolase [Glarea lozoyensis ATCC 20868]
MQSTIAPRKFLGLQLSRSNNGVLFRKALSTTTPHKPSTAEFPHGALSYHWDTTEPTASQLVHASKFFNLQPPKFLWSAEKFKTMDFGGSPEICFLGRSNVGKSSLLNTLLSKRIAHTSSKPGRTRLMNAFAVGGREDNASNRLVVLDMPGYGKGGRAEWGKEVLKYLGKRRQLKRAFLLVDSEHGIKNSDKQLLALFQEHSVPYQIVLSKADRIIFPDNRKPSPEVLALRLAALRKTMETIKDEVEPDPEGDLLATGEVIACSSEKWVGAKRMGIDAVRFAMLRAAGLELKPKITLAKPTEIVSFDELEMS